MLKDIIAVIILLFAAPCFARDWLVQMLNYSEAGGMLFQLQFIHAQRGDSVTFVVTHSEHHVQSYELAEGWLAH